MRWVLVLLAVGCGGVEGADGSAKAAQVACDPCPGAMATSMFHAQQDCWCQRRATQVDRCNCGPNGCAAYLSFTTEAPIYDCARTQTVFATLCASDLVCCSVLHGDGSHLGDVTACVCDSSC